MGKRKGKQKASSDEPEKKKSRTEEPVTLDDSNSFVLSMMSANLQKGAADTELLAQLLADNKIDLLNAQEAQSEEQAKKVAKKANELRKSASYQVIVSDSKTEDGTLKPWIEDKSLDEEDRKNMEDQEAISYSGTGNNDLYWTIFNSKVLEMKNEPTLTRYDGDKKARQQLTIQKSKGTKSRKPTYGLNKAQMHLVQNRQPLLTQFTHRATGTTFTNLNLHNAEGGGMHCNKKGEEISGRDALPNLQLFGGSSTFEEAREKGPVVGGMDANLGKKHVANTLGLAPEQVASHRLDSLFTTQGTASNPHTADIGSDHLALMGTLRIPMEEK